MVNISTLPTNEVPECPLEWRYPPFNDFNVDVFVEWGKLLYIGIGLSGKTREPSTIWENNVR